MPPTLPKRKLKEMPQTEDQHLKTDKPEKRVRRPFLRGAIFGLLVAAIFGLLTYPWSRPHFEGASGYHMLMMIFVVPVFTVAGGILFAVVAKFRESRIKADR